MANVFSITNNQNNRPKRNTYDLSFQNNLTGKFGILYPAIFQRVIPGNSCKIKPTFALQFMPMTFPVQTRMRAHLHFFYVRRRNLWKDFPDYYAKTKSNLVVPYVNINTQQKMDAMASTGSLGDYLNIPTTAFGEYGIRPNIGNGDLYSTVPVAMGSKPGGLPAGNDWSSMNFPTSVMFDGNESDSQVVDKVNHMNSLLVNRPLIISEMSQAGTIAQMALDAYGNSGSGLIFTSMGSIGTVDASHNTLSIVMAFDPRSTTAVINKGYAYVAMAFPNNYHDPTSFDIQVLPFALFKLEENSPHNILFDFVARNEKEGLEKTIQASGVVQLHTTKNGTNAVSITFSFSSSDLPTGWEVYAVPGLLSHTDITATFHFYNTSNTDPLSIYLDKNGDPTYFLTSMISDRPSIGTYGVLPDFQWDENVELSDLKQGSVSYPADYVPGAPLEYNLQNSPWYSSLNPNNSKQIKLNAEPFRAYESVYNAFYRDERNNPYILNGEAEYNKWIPTQDGGEDNNIYKLRYRNWEQDFLTTAVQSPQQGIAPLVGIVSYNDQTSLAFTDQETGESFKANVSTDEDGTVTKFDVERTDQPVRTFTSLVDMVQSGISINDFRNVNALQRWLEMNMRKGYRLRDIIKGHFDVNVRFDELDMPEFIGGVSEDIRTSMVTQTSADQEGSPLGSFAGQAVCIGTSKHTIRHYFDEPGYLIGIFSVAPVPNYSQLLPKYFTENDVLDNYFPEFGHIGYQPITYKEVCPIQSYLAGQDVNDIFGYQRPWYDYLQNVDQVHGLFRTSLRDYLINRVFDKRPQLSESFLLIDPSQTNNIFTVTTENDDVFVGQIYFDFSMKSPIPLHGVARLE